MSVRFFYDLSKIDLDAVAISHDEILAANPQRYEFEQIDFVPYFNPEERIIVGVRDLRPDEFWVRGHMPGRPIFPGVLMLEAAAQLGAIYCSRVVVPDGTHGFGGADEVRFRRMLTVGDRLVIVATPEVITPRRSKFRTQGIAGGQLAFEASIFGISLPKRS